MPISKQRNKHIQRVLIEAAKLAPGYSHELAMIHAKRTGERQPQPGHAGSCQEDGLLHARSGAQEAGFRACRGVQPNGGSVKTFPNEGKTKTSGFYRCADCQVPP